MLEIFTEVIIHACNEVCKLHAIYRACHIAVHTKETQNGYVLFKVNSKLINLYACESDVALHDLIYLGLYNSILTPFYYFRIGQRQENSMTRI